MEGTMGRGNKSAKNDQAPYPLVNVYIANWKIYPFSMGKSTINGQFP